MTTQEMKDLRVQEKRELKSEQPTHQGLFFEPSVDIFETSSALTLLADVPGATANDLEIDVRDNVLTLRARAKRPDGRWKPLYEEYRLGDYTRQFRLGAQIDQSRITATIKDGVLMLQLPKPEAAQPRRIQVEKVG